MPTSSQRLGVLGYGHFGRAFGALLREAGHAVRAFDPWQAIEPADAVANPAALAAWADVVVLAVPVAAMGEALGGLRPRLEARHLVFDVGSVKTAPTALMGAVLGAAVPWVGTHPLFGPTSLALGEPLTAVVCPNPLHPAAFETVCRLYETLGCRVIVKDAEAHDRGMADTHALAYFIAKALLDAGVEMDAQLAPPSARGLARTVASVRSDAGHLFTTVHRENPFSGDARRRFLDALHEADAALREIDAADPGPGLAPPALSIPDLGAQSPALREVRDLIDDIDRDLVRVLARRAQLAKRARTAKAGLGHGVRDARREDELLALRRSWAAEQGLDPVAIEGVFEAILRFSRRMQARDGEERP